MAKNQAFERQLPSEVDMNSADQLRTILASSIGTDGPDPVIKVSVPGGAVADVVLTHSLAEAFFNILRLISSGKGFQVVPYGAELTTQQAADFLNVSRPFLIKLLERGEMTFSKTGRHRRIKAEDLFEFMARRDAERDEALSQLAAEDAAEGL